MTTARDMNEYIIAKAAAEAGIREDERSAARIVGEDRGICELEITTEWNIVTCYADSATGEILGLMAEARPVEELLRDTLTASMRIAAKASPDRAA